MPVPAYNTFNEVFDSLDSDDNDAATPFKIELIKPDDFTIKNWPVQPGDYRVLNATKSIALAVLKGIDLDNPALASLHSKIAIIGSITTENLGVEHYSNDGRLMNIVEGRDSASICATLVDKNLISQLDHAAYLGRELAKAELSLVSDSTYAQDRAQGELC